MLPQMRVEKEYTSTPLRYFFVMLVLFLCTFFACKDQTTQSDTSTIVFPSSGVSFNKQVMPLFEQTCSAAGCHSGSQPAANLNLQYFTWASLLDFQPKIVVPYSSKTSLLYTSISGNPQLMPPRQRLTQNQIDGVKKWIDEGALNN